MAELQVDMHEIGLIMMGLTHIDDAKLNDQAKDARARLAYKLGAAAGDLLRAASDSDA